MIKHILNTIKFIVVLIMSLALLVCYYQSLYPPAKIGVLAFSGFAFPYLWALCAILFVLLLVFHSRISALVTFLALVATFSGAMSIVSFIPNTPAVTEGKQLKIVTFNICHLSKAANGKDIAIEQMKELLADADIVCLQEASTGKMMQNELNGSDYAKTFGFKYQVQDRYADRSAPVGTTAQVILSRYPVTKEAPIDNEIDKHLMPTVVDVEGQKVRLINCHLESIRLLPDQIEAVNKIQRVDIHERAKTKTEIKTTYTKMNNAFRYRSIQTDTLVSLIKSSDIPVIVCGDFNDTPISYTYRQITSILEDTFDRSFMSIGHTYNGDLPKLRIDYIFHSKDIKSIDYRVNKQDISDHYAVVSTVMLP